MECRTYVNRKINKYKITNFEIEIKSWNMGKSFDGNYVNNFFYIFSKYFLKYLLFWFLLNSGKE